MNSSKASNNVWNDGEDGSPNGRSPPSPGLSQVSRGSLLSRSGEKFGNVKVEVS